MSYQCLWWWWPVERQIVCLLIRLLGRQIFDETESTFIMVIIRSSSWSSYEHLMIIMWSSYEHLMTITTTWGCPSAAEHRQELQVPVWALFISLWSGWEFIFHPLFVIDIQAKPVHLLGLSLQAIPAGGEAADDNLAQPENIHHRLYSLWAEGCFPI